MNNSYFSRFKDQYKAIKTQFKKMPEKERKKQKIKYGLIAFLCLFIAALVGGQTTRWFLYMLNPENVKYGILYYGLLNPLGLLITIPVFLGFIFLMVTYLFRRNLNNGVLYVDENGVAHAINKDQGSAEFMNEEEAKKVFDIKDILDTDQTIYGQLTEDGTQTVSFKAKTKGATGNQNLLLIGSPGTGKSFTFVRSNIVQAMKRGASIIATDPSGELFQDLASLLRKNGYMTKVLNLAEPRYSDFWNCMEEVIDPETGRLDGTRLNDFTSIYVKNSGDSNGGGDKFWSDGAINLLRAVIGYASWQREVDILSHYKELYARVALGNPDRDKKLDAMADEKLPSFTWVENTILETAVANGFDKKEIEDNIQKIKDSAPPFTIREVFNYLMTFRNIETEFDNLPMSHPARQAYIIFSDASDTVKASTINGTRLRMQIFADEKLMNALSYDGIKISDINLKKCAFFVNMSDKSTATTPIASLFFSFFFKDAQDNWDKWSKISESEKIPNPCLDTFVMLDEFFSIGVIGGDPKAFATTMSVNRKRHIAINIAIQSITQLPALYGKENASNIQTCCDYTLFLGCNDETTAKLISSFFAGQSTILTERHNESINVFGTAGDGTNVNLSSSKRDLLTVDEVRRWKNKVLLVKRGEKPLELNPVPWTLHPVYINGEVKKESIYSTIVPIEDRVREITSKPKSSFNEVSNQINRVKSANSKAAYKNYTNKNEQMALGLDDKLAKAKEKTMKNRKANKANSNINDLF